MCGATSSTVISTTSARPALPTGDRELRIGGDQPWDSFAGFIAEARIWNVARDQADIRRTMHSYVDEKMPGLVAAWPFRAQTGPTSSVGGWARPTARSRASTLWARTASQSQHEARCRQLLAAAIARPRKRF